MKKSILKYFIFLIIFLISCTEEITNPPQIIQSPESSTFEASYALEWMNLTYDIVTLEDIPAPTASRFYGYCGIALYEAVCRGIPGSRSLGGQLRDMPQIPSPENELYDWPTVLAATLKIVATNILYQPQQFSIDMINDLYDEQIVNRNLEINETTVNRSIAYGEQVGNKIIEWSNSDNFLSTRDLPYEPPPRSNNPSFWEPTFPGQHALEPYLGTQKPFCMVTQNQCSVPLGIQFDTIPGTPFYYEGYEVLDKSMNLTTDERNIAFFWEDKAGTGQPPGHWVSITNNMVDRFSIKLDEAAKIYALVGVTIRDAFISAWETKYSVNLLRPITYIREYMGEPNWSELVATPPFPEYPSGHSVVSGGVSKILTVSFGDNIAFIDSTHNNEPGLRNRNFNSFYDAADEAAWSRLYGGIHFRSAILNGIQQGKLVADVVLNTVYFE
ncbi:MAG: vanadium-dependent haloperoxidase [Ignavibacteriaceae bacterium]|nr:vanadium-dependent haloperoxidase [Ignavibacteriaceae bacterium]